MDLRIFLPLLETEPPAVDILLNRSAVLSGRVNRIKVTRQNVCHQDTKLDIPIDFLTLCRREENPDSLGRETPYANVHQIRSVDRCTVLTIGRFGSKLKRTPRLILLVDWLIKIFLLGVHQGPICSKTINYVRQTPLKRANLPLFIAPFFVSGFPSWFDTAFSPTGVISVKTCAFRFRALMRSTLLFFLAMPSAFSACLGCEFAPCLALILIPGPFSFPAIGRKTSFETGLTDLSTGGTGKARKEGPSVDVSAEDGGRIGWSFRIAVGGCSSSCL